MNRWTVLFVTMLLTMFVAMGCSGNGGSPVSPNAGPGITGSDLSGQSLGTNTYLAGYYECYLDIPTKTMEVVADRTANFTLNIIPFLNQMNDPKMGITFGSLEVDDSDPAVLKVDVNFEWYHPFPALDQYKAYDMMGVIISNGDTSLGYEGLTVGQQGSDTYMTNADGYTRWFNPTEFTTELIFGWAPGGIQNLAGDALINPYKAYGLGLGPDDDLWGWLTGADVGDGLWDSGAGRMMNLEFPNPPGDGLTFAYAAVVCWVEQGSDPPGGYTPYHRAEPIGCKATVTDNIYYDGATTGGNLIIDADLWSWGAPPSTVKVESTVLSGVVNMEPGTAGGDNISTYHLDVPADVALDSVDGQEFWVIAECGAYGYKPVTELGEVLEIPSADGVLASFFRFPLTISSEPPASIVVVSIAPVSGTTNSGVVHATITCVDINSAGLGAALTMGATQIDGTNVDWVNVTSLTCDFDLTSAPVGIYDVWVYNDEVPGGGKLYGGFEVLPCDTTYVSVDPDKGGVDKTVTVEVELATCVDGPYFEAILQSANPDIVGTNATYVDATHFEVDFDLTGAALGLYDISVTNGCGGDPDIGIEAFEVTLITAGWVIELQDALPTPLPTGDVKAFCVQGNATIAANAGVFYHYTTGGDYLIYKYPLDYSSGGTLYRTLSHWMGMASMFGPPSYMDAFEITPTGCTYASSNWTSVVYGQYQADTFPWWTGSSGGAFSIGLIAVTNGGAGTSTMLDFDKGYGLTSDIWGFWKNPTHDGMVYGDQFKCTAPFGVYNYSEFVGYVPYDTSGGADGYVDDTNSKRFAVDDNPQGLDSSFDVIFYYLEGAPATPAIECIENNKAMALPNCLATIKTFEGTPIDLTTFNAFYSGGPGTSNWVVALEQVGSEWLIEAWTQDGTLVSASESVTGTALGVDLDATNHKVHVWYDDGGTLSYVVWIYQL